MSRFLVLSLSILVTACSGKLRIGDEGNCITTTPVTENQSGGSTAAASVLRTAVFDTTASAIYGFVKDAGRGIPIAGASVVMYKDAEPYTTTTDDSGAFSFFRNLSPGRWDLRIEHAGYKCLIVEDASKAGGTWLAIKLSVEKR